MNFEIIYYWTPLSKVRQDLFNLEHVRRIKDNLLKTERNALFLQNK